MSLIKTNLKELDILGYSSIYNLILTKIVNNLTDRYTNFDYRFDEDGKFIDKIKELCNIKVRMIRSINHNYLPLEAVNYLTDDAIMKISGSSCDMPTSLNTKKLVSTKAKSEFLERMSMYLPLDFAIKNNYSLDLVTNYLQNRSSKLKSILSNRIISIPENFFYLLIKNDPVTYFGAPVSNNRKPPQSSSNGCSAHFDINKAIVSGWLEVIQRDGFLVHWLNTISPKWIDIEAYLTKIEFEFKVNSNDLYENLYKETEKLRKIISSIKKYYLNYCLLDITSDIDVPNVLCVVWCYDTSGARRLTIGADVDFDSITAIESAILEAVITLSTRHNIGNNNLENDIENYIPFVDNNIARDDRIKFYFGTEVGKHIDFLLSNYNSENKITYEDWSTVKGRIEKRGYGLKRIAYDAQYQIKYLKSIFREKINKANTLHEDVAPDYNVYIFEYKNKLIKYYGLKVVKVICPALYSLYLNEDYADPNHPRLAEFVKNKGLEGIAKLNIWPHPFP